MIHRKTTPEELALILEEGEGYTLEFKQNVNADLAKELVAFANASGGRIFIGVADNNQITGCRFSNALFSRIEAMAASCDPPVTLFIEKLPDQHIIVIHVPEGANRPHRCTKGFYLRNGASSQKMSTADITAFIQSEGKVRFDQQLRMDLDWQEVLDLSR
ncbi:MAG: ATP-binding protein, partial [Desulfotignum sp.]|nr:ATP-binding protein [Desulfotignum sp.]